ncbi:MAG TPA: endonuclease/exonuclease/phosphatase family protein [Sedimentisphaerales bacterium]|nr:endonuclease/exonuclease/phosphatase family protein [Sedimentisphaerales bacterium]
MYSKRPSIMTHVFLSLAIPLVLWTFFGLCCADAAGVGAGELELRIMTFNIRYGSANDGENSWNKRKEMVCDVIRNHPSDVVGLQEALRFQMDSIREDLPVYGEIGVAREDGNNNGEYSSVLYRTDRFGVGESGTFWFSDTPEIAGSNTWGNACVRICSWARLIETKTGKAFYIYNLHLDHVSQPSREKSAVLLAERIKNRRYKEPFVVTGDFNAGENNPVITYLKGDIAVEGPGGIKVKTPVTMVDTFRVLHPDAKDVKSAHGFRGTRQGNKIDYVFVPSGTKVLEAQILYDNTDGRYPSDHYPVIASFVLNVPS